MRVDLHCHSSFSYDGAVPPQRLVELAVERGLTHLAITDHETIEGALMARRVAPLGLVVIVGQEARTTEGDLIALFVEQPIPAGLTAQETAGRIRDQGGLVGMPHGFDGRRPSIARGAARPADLARLAAVVDYVEVHNGRVQRQSSNAQAADFARAYGLAAAAVSDAHTEPEVGTAATVIQGSAASAKKLLAALRGPGALFAREAFPSSSQSLLPRKKVP